MLHRLANTKAKANPLRVLAAEQADEERGSERISGTPLAMHRPERMKQRKRGADAFNTMCLRFDTTQTSRVRQITHSMMEMMRNGMKKPS